MPDSSKNDRATASLLYLAEGCALNPKHANRMSAKPTPLTRSQAASQQERTYAMSRHKNPKVLPAWMLSCPHLSCQHCQAISLGCTAR